MWQMAEMLGHNVTRETRDYFNRLLQIAIDSHDAQIPRHRKEYRMLTDEERERFHNAILALKNDTVKQQLLVIHKITLVNVNAPEVTTTNWCWGAGVKSIAIDFMISL